MAEQLAGNLWKLRIPLVGNPLKTLNSYLLLGERSLLIDTGFRQEPCREAMERQLEETGVDRDRMDIFCTHLHSDHTGLAPELIRPGCRIYIGEIDAPILRRSAEPGYWADLYREYVLDGFSPQEMEALWGTNPAKTSAPAWREGLYTPLRDGETLTGYGGGLRCVLTPGHTPGHLCLYDPDRRRLFCGDHVLFHITPNICRWQGTADALGDYLESLDRTAALEVAELYPAHREETGSLRRRTEELKRHHAQRLSDALDAVRRTPGLNAYEIAARMSWSIRCRSWADFPLTQKFFAVGEALAHLDDLEVRGRIRRETRAGKRVYFPAEPCRET